MEGMVRRVLRLINSFLVTMEMRTANVPPDIAARSFGHTGGLGALLEISSFHLTIQPESSTPFITQGADERPFRHGADLTHGDHFSRRQVAERLKKRSHKQPRPPREMWTPR
jgi:hypothetical protein